MTHLMFKGTQQFLAAGYRSSHAQACFQHKLLLEHTHRMMESMTQLMFKGYEEARVALTTLLFTVSCESF